MPADSSCEICYCSFFTHRRECMLRLPEDASNPPPQWSNWSDFSSCSAPCGTGARRRSRACLKLCANDTRMCAPDASGRMDSDQQPCNRQDCLPPIDCQVSDWVNGTCFAICDGVNPSAIGQQLRLRRITRQPANGGMACPPYFEIVPCTRDCPVDCLLGQWSAWSERVKSCVGTLCNPSCGVGERIRTRPIQRPSANGGQPCVDREFLPSLMPCNETACSGPEAMIPCSTKCLRSCNDVRASKQCQDAGCVPGCGCQGDKLREEDSCVNLAECNCAHPSNVSKLMPPGSTVTKDCNTCVCTNGLFVCGTTRCAQDCEWSVWQKVGSCNVTCGTGKQQWSRTIAKPAVGGGAECTGPTVQFTDCFGDEGACCNPNDDYVDSGRCEATCQQLLNPSVAQPGSSCRPGCQCKLGLVRDVVSGRCILLSNCFGCLDSAGNPLPDGSGSVDLTKCSMRYCLHGLLIVRPLLPNEAPPCTQSDASLSAVEGSVKVMDETNCCYRVHLPICRKGVTQLWGAPRPGSKPCKFLKPIKIDRCFGACPSSHSVFVTETGAVQVIGDCQCCRPTAYFAKPPIPVACSDGSVMMVTLFGIENCRCTNVKSPPF